MLSCYYAHCLSLYDTPQERRDLELLERLGFKPVNPNQPKLQEACDALRAEYGRFELDVPGKNVMYEVFRPIVLNSDALAFRALSPSGGISSGAHQEIQWAKRAGIPVFELPEGIIRRSMSLAQTREHLREAGQR